jgi:hypothetical protein
MAGPYRTTGLGVGILVDFIDQLYFVDELILYHTYKNTSKTDNNNFYFIL